jgi:hypothetical protein
MPREESTSTQWNHANPVLEVSDVARAIAYYHLRVPRPAALTVEAGGVC